MKLVRKLRISRVSASLGSTIQGIPGRSLAEKGELMGGSVSNGGAELLAMVSSASFGFVGSVGSLRGFKLYFLDLLERDG